MKRKIFGIIALAAFIATTAFSTVGAMVQQDTIWVYENDGTTTMSPFCPIPSDEVCARKHEYNPVTGEIGDPLPGPGNVITGERL